MPVRIPVEDAEHAPRPEAEHSRPVTEPVEGPFGPADRQRRTEIAAAHLDQFMAQAEIPPAAEAPTRVVNRYGKDAAVAAGHAITMVRGAPSTFVRLTRDGTTVDQRIAQNSGRLAYVDQAISMVDEQRGVLARERTRLVGNLVKDLDDCRKASEAVLDNPAADPDEQKQLRTSSLGFRNHLAERAESAQAKKETTAALKDTIAERDAALADKDVKIKYLEGEELKPGDIKPRTVVKDKPGPGRRRPR
jgi:hypothetical protein